MQAPGEHAAPVASVQGECERAEERTDHAHEERVPDYALADLQAQQSCVFSQSHTDEEGCELDHYARYE